MTASNDFLPPQHYYIPMYELMEVNLHVIPTIGWQSTTEKHGRHPGSAALRPTAAKAISAACSNPASSRCPLFHVVSLSKQNIFITVDLLITKGLQKKSLLIQTLLMERSIFTAR